MSITGFNRRRRELYRTEALNKEVLDEVKEETTDEAIEKTSKEESVNEAIEEDKIDYLKLKVDELKDIAKEKGIEYDSKAKKEDLIKLLEGAE